MLDWGVYWFMLPVCVGIASIAMFSGSSGAALLTPILLLGFPLLGVPRLTAVEAIGTSLLLETSGFGTGVYRYLRRGLVDAATVSRLQFIRTAQAAGLTLVEIASIVDLRDDGEIPCTHVHALLLQKLQSVRERQRELASLKAELERLIARSLRLDPAACTETDICNILTASD